MKENELSWVAMKQSVGLHGGIDRLCVGVTQNPNPGDRDANRHPISDAEG